MSCAKVFFGCRARGFTLIESLVAILVLSVGMLGLAALQINSLKSADYSYQRTVATLAAKDMAERVWGYLLASEDFYGEEDISLRVISCPVFGDKEDDKELNVTFSNVVGAWEEDWAPVGSSEDWPIPWLHYSIYDLGGAGCFYRIILSWRDGRFGEEGESSLTYSFGLPEQVSI